MSHNPNKTNIHQTDLDQRSAYIDITSSDPDVYLMGVNDGRKMAEPAPIRVKRSGFRYVLANANDAPRGSLRFILWEMACHRATHEAGLLSVGSDELATLTGLHPGTVRRHLHTAVKQGWLRRVKVGGTRGQNRGEVSRYAFTIPLAVAITARPHDVVNESDIPPTTTAHDARRSEPTTAHEVHDHRASSAPSTGSNQLRPTRPRSDGQSSTEEKTTRPPSEVFAEADPSGWAAALAEAKKHGKGRGYAVGVYRNRVKEANADAEDTQHLETLKTQPCPDPKCDHGYVRLRPDDAYGHPCDSEPCRLRREVR